MKLTDGDPNNLNMHHQALNFVILGQGKFFLGHICLLHYTTIGRPR